MRRTKTQRIAAVARAVVSRRAKARARVIENTPPQRRSKRHTYETIH